MTTFVDEKFTEAQISQIKATRPAWAETVREGYRRMSVDLEGPVTSIAVKDLDSAGNDITIVQVQATRSMYPDGEVGPLMVTISRPDGGSVQDFALEDAQQVADAIRSTVYEVNRAGGMAVPSFDHVTDALTSVVTNLMESLGLKEADVAERIGMPSRSFQRVLAGAKPWTVEALREVGKVVGVRPSDLLAWANDQTKNDAGERRG